MYKIVLLFLLLPVYSMAQEDSLLYLTTDNKIVATKADYTCRLNTVLSTTGYISCYDCYDDRNKLVRQLTNNIRVSDTIQTAQAIPYVKSYGDANYLIGELKEEKPYNGFFKHNNPDSEWLLYDFYKEGEQVAQFYHNIIYKGTMAMEESGEEPMPRLDNAGSFVNGRLEKGIEVTFQEQQGAFLEITRVVKNFTTEYFIVSLGTMHYGELIKVIPVPQGYQLESIDRSGVRITFNNNERQVEYLDDQGQPINKTQFVQYDAETAASIDRTQPSFYFQKNNKLYIEQVKTPSKPSFEEEAASINSTVIKYFIRYFYTYKVLEVTDLKNFVEEGKRNRNFLGYYQMDEGKHNGFVYTKGDKPGTYNLNLYREGKIEKDAKLIIRNKTLSEISELLKSIL